MNATPDGTTPAALGREGFYVTVKRDSRTGFLLGPEGSKEAAEARVPEGRRLAERVDSFTAFDAFGVTRVQVRPGAELRPGVLNELAAREAPAADREAG